MRDRDADFERFFVAESERLRRLGLFMTGDPQRAADLAQEALAVTYRHWRRIRLGDPAPYARQVLTNLVRSAHRRKMVELRRSLPAESTVSGPDQSVDEWLRFASVLKQLSPIRRATILLRFYEDMSEADIAVALDRPIGTVKSDIHRALNQLRPLLDENEKEPA